jgi:hypothetical protein
MPRVPYAIFRNAILAGRQVVCSYDGRAREHSVLARMKRSAIPERLIHLTDSPDFAALHPRVIGGDR